MRVSSKSFQLQWLANFTSRQVELADIQRQVSTGKRVATAADDPAGASQIVQLQDGLNRLERYAANAATARRRLGLEESALAEAGDDPQALRDAIAGTELEASTGAISFNDLGEVRKDVQVQVVKDGAWHHHSVISDPALLAPPDS